MPHTIALTRTTTTTTSSSAIIINVGYCKTIPGILRCLEVVSRTRLEGRIWSPFINEASLIMPSLWPPLPGNGDHLLHHHSGDVPQLLRSMGAEHRGGIWGRQERDVFPTLGLRVFPLLDSAARRVPWLARHRGCARQN